MFFIYRPYYVASIYSVMVPGVIPPNTPCKYSHMIKFGYYFNINSIKLFMLFILILALLSQHTQMLSDDLPIAFCFTKLTLKSMGFWVGVMLKVKK